MAVPFCHGRHMLSCRLAYSVRNYAGKKSGKPKSSSSVKVKEIFSRNGSVETDSPGSFSEMCARRRQEAARSLLVQVPSRRHVPNVYNLIKQCGNVKNIFHFSHIRDYVLVEMENREVVELVLQSTSHFSNVEKIPVESRVLLLTAADIPIKQTLPLPVHADSAERFQLSDCFKANTVSDQIELLYDHNHLTDLGCRLRFFVCSNLEDMLSGLFPQCSVQPFGSTVNGFGKRDCDLDMTLTLLQQHQQSGFKNPHLKFMTKKRTDNERGFVQRSLHTVADIIEQFVPLCLGVQRILNARVPIIKFLHEACNIECDLSFSHMSGPQMSEVLWLWSELDERVRPLVFCVRHWARVNEVTRKHPGPWVSNFMLTVLVVFFLQSVPDKILPSIIIKGGDKDVASDITVDYSSLKGSRNTQNLGELLKEFFAFYSSFDFQSQAMSVIHGSTYRKPDFSPMYIENPLDVNLNISQNINITELEKLKTAFQTALWNLETSDSKENRAWGLMRILLPNGNTNSNKVHLTMGDLFTDSETDRKTDRLTDTPLFSDSKSDSSPSS